VFFANRCDAGRRLAAQLHPFETHRPIVLGLPRGGIPVAYEVAHALGAPLDLLMVRKLGAPGQPELAIGAVAPGIVVLDDETIALLRVPEDYVARVRVQETHALEDGLRRFRGTRPFPDVAGRTVILVDDGIATGATALAAVDAVRAHGAARVVVAAPVAAPDAVTRLRAAADDVVVLETPPAFQAVGYWYSDFTATTDDEVRQMLRRAHREEDAHYHPPATS